MPAYGVASGGSNLDQLQHVTPVYALPDNVKAMGQRTIVTAVVVLLLGALGWYVFLSSPPGPQRQFGGAGRPTAVGAVAVSLEPIADRVEALGTAQANESVTITANLTDTVRRVNFSDGDYVKVNTVLVEMTNAEEEAQLAEARANLDDARRNLKRQQDLGERGIASASAVDGAITAEAGAEARLNTVVARLQDRLIRAPFTGVLGFREVSPGTLVTPGTSITTLDDTSKIKLDFTIPEASLSLVHRGSTVNARAAGAAGREFQGEVTALGSRVDPVTRAVTVRAIIDNEDGALLPGMLLNVHVQSRERQALMIPEKSIVQLVGESFVCVAVTGQAIRRGVELGRREFGSVEVVAGLEPGELVIHEGVVRLRDGLAIAVESELATPGQSPRPAAGTNGNGPSQRP
jgi:membrane fusion protein (multidrug efflux system)